MYSNSGETNVRYFKLFEKIKNNEVSFYKVSKYNTCTLYSQYTGQGLRA